MTQALQDLGEHISAALSQEVLKAEVLKGELILLVRAAAIRKVLTIRSANCASMWSITCCR
jgi:hypothetical protein